MIRAEHIVKSFDGRVVLDDISVEFETGKTNLIIGRSGSGKTVLLIDTSTPSMCPTAGRRTPLFPRRSTARSMAVAPWT